jgi:hypothetical protein
MKIIFKKPFQVDTNMSVPKGQIGYLRAVQCSPEKGDMYFVDTKGFVMLEVPNGFIEIVSEKKSE